MNFARLLILLGVKVVAWDLNRNTCLNGDTYLNIHG